MDGLYREVEKRIDTARVIILTENGKIMEKILAQTVELIKMIEDSKEHDSYKESYIKMLRDIEKVLSGEPLDLDKLSKDEFGIFRLVTDGSGDSPIEQELMSFLQKIYLFRQTLKETPGNNKDINVPRLER